MTHGARTPNDLCVGCAMCCNGTLFNRARYEPGEESKLTAGNLQTVSVENKHYFLQPCPYERCGKCTVYETRFEVCRAFKCGILKRHEGGEIDFGEARSLVSKALILRAAVTSADPLAGEYAKRQELRRELTAQLANGSVTDRASTARRLLSMSVLDAYLDRWFRTAKNNPEA